MMTATQMKTGEFMGRTGEDESRSELPDGYSISAEYGLISLKHGGVLLMALLDPLHHGIGADPASTRRSMEGDLTLAARHHQDARDLLSEELDQRRMSLNDSAEVTSRRRIARRADYYAALEAANSRAQAAFCDGGNR